MKDYKIYTSFYGILLIHLAAYFVLGKEDIRYYTYRPNRGQRDFVYISLFQKHGLYKCKMLDKNSYEFYKGTEKLFWSSNFNAYKQIEK